MTEDAAERPASRRRRRDALVGATVLIGVIVASFAVYQTRQGATPGGFPTTYRHTIRIDGTPYRAAPEVGWAGVVVDAANPRLLHVLVDRTEPNPPDPRCQERHPVAYIRHENTRTVTVSVAAYSPASTFGRSTGGAHEGFWCGRPHIAYDQLPVRLSKPLGTRRVVDSLGDIGPVVRAADIPQVPTVPRGYVAEPVTLEPLPVPVTKPTDRPPVIGLRVYHHGIDRLELRTGPPQYLSQQTTQLGWPTVGSSQASLTASSLQPVLCLTWDRSANRAIQLCSEGDTRSSSDYPPPPPLPDTTLIAMARALR